MVSGCASGRAVAAAAAWRARVEGRSAWRPNNGMSHMVWGRRAAPRGPVYFVRSAGRAIGVSILAYVTDYYLVPRRFTPGFELSLSRRSCPWVYGALAAGLVAPDWLAPVGSRSDK